MPQPTIITDEEDFPIKPSDINDGGPLWNAFDNSETEISARYILELMQASGDWREFTYKELSDLHAKAGFGPRYVFNHLIGPFRVGGSQGTYTDHLDVVVCTSRDDEDYPNRYEDEDTFRVTDQFVTRCFISARVPRLKQAATAQSVTN